MRMHVGGLLIWVSFSFSLMAGEKDITLETQKDSNTVIELNKRGYESRLSDAEQSLTYAEQALKLAKELDYRNGEAEAYRIKGIAKYYLNETGNAIANYLIALSIFKAEKNTLGQAKVYNNIGNLYLGADYEKALIYFNKALKLGKILGNKDLLGNIYLNIGNIYVRKKKFNQALAFYEKGNNFYTQTQNETGIIQCLQNRGKIYYELNQQDKAEKLLSEANLKAKALDLNGVIASINLTLTSVYIVKKDFKKAENILNEGIAFAKLVKDNKLIYDFEYTYFELEFQRKHFEQAIYHLRQVYRQDSISYKNSESSKIGLLQEQFRQKEIQRENELIILRQKQNTIILISTAIVTAMSIVVIILLSRNVRRKIKSNRELTRLNEEVMKQKENLDKINQNLEKLIDERTKDLRNKNRKLSEYSAHLSHEIRGPVASMMGLMILEKEKIIEHEDLMDKLRICINSIDDKIHRINDMLHDPDISNLSGE
ncbi:MAG: tetratricopeptide repeat protein [Sphingobacteriaceae bacterium]